MFFPPESSNNYPYSSQSLQLGQREAHGKARITAIQRCIYFHLTLIRHLLLMYSLNFHPSRYFDGNLDKLFSECHVINPSKKSRTRPSINTRSSAQDMPCQICYLNYPNSVSFLTVHGH